MSALDPGLASALDRLAGAPHPLVALDFDGCLAPLVDDRDAARPDPRASAALAGLAALTGGRALHLALVSGRPLASLVSLASPPAVLALVGSHGGQVRMPGADETTAPLGHAQRALLGDVVERVRAVSAAAPGTDVEVKPAGVVLHVRGADVATATRSLRAVADGPGRLPGVRVMRGKDVLEMSVLDVDKGRSLTMLREALDAAPVLYAGDDVTDEHALVTLDAAAGDVGVKVGEGESAAGFRVRDPAAVADLLEHLLAARSR